MAIWDMLIYRPFYAEDICHRRLHKPNQEQQQTIKVKAFYPKTFRKIYMTNLLKNEIIVVIFSHLVLKTHQQIFKKGCLEKCCSCGKAWQFSALQGAPCRSYLGKLKNGDQYINKKGRLFMHDMCLERVNKEISLGRNNQDISLKLFRGSHLFKMAV